MRLATIRLGDQTAAVRVEGTTAIETGFADVGALLRAGGLEAAATADGARHDVVTVEVAVPRKLSKAAADALKQFAEASDGTDPRAGLVAAARA